MNSLLTKLVSLAMDAILIVSAILAVLKADIYWTAVALWAISLVSAPNILSRIIPDKSVHWFIVITFSPYLVSLVLEPSGNGVLPLDSGLYWLFSGLSVFMLSLATVGYFARYTKLKLNLKFAMIIAYVLFVSAYILQIPVYYYSDELFGLDILPDNFMLMGNFILACVFGLVLTVSMFHALKRTSLVERHETGQEAGSS